MRCGILRFYLPMRNSRFALAMTAVKSLSVYYSGIPMVAVLLRHALVSLQNICVLVSSGKYSVYFVGFVFFAESE